MQFPPNSLALGFLPTEQAVLNPKAFHLFGFARCNIHEGADMSGIIMGSIRSKMGDRTIYGPAIVSAGEPQHVLLRARFTSARGFEDILYCPRPILGVQSINPAVSKVLQRITASHLPPEATDVAASPLKISDENHYWRRISQSAKIGRAFEHHVLGGAVSLGKILEEILLSKIAGLRHTHNSRGSRKPNSYQ